MANKSLEKDVRNKNNMLVSFYLQHMEVNIHILY